MKNLKMYKTIKRVAIVALILFVSLLMLLMLITPVFIVDGARLPVQASFLYSGLILLIGIVASISIIYVCRSNIRKEIERKNKNGEPINICVCSQCGEEKVYQGYSYTEGDHRNFPYPC